MYLRAPRGRKPASRPGPVSALMEDEFHAKEWPGGRGEFLVAGPHVPQPPPQLQVGFPPPDWEQELRERGEQADPGPQQPAGTAIEAMMSNAVELGEVEWPELDLGPPAVVEPLRYRIPEPSWREELAAAEARDERDRLANAAKLLGLEQAPKPDYPAPKRSLSLPVPEPEPGQLRPRIPAPPWAEGGAA